MDDDPAVSVIMGVHDEAAFVGDAVDSILAQSFADFEFLVVDDASTDGSRAIVESYDDERIELLENESNRGLTRSLNRALREASGEYVARQDADDESHPRRLERQVRFLEREPDVALVGTGAHLIDEDGSTRARRVVLRDPTFEVLLDKNHIIHGSILARRAVLEELGGYDEFFRYGQDLDLWLRLTRDHRVANIPEPLYRLRIHDESVYFSRKDESALYSMFANHRARGALSEAAERRVRSEGIETYYEELSDEHRAAFHRDLAVRYLRYGHAERAREECRSALAYDPRSPKTLGLYALTFGGDRLVGPLLSVARRGLNVTYWLENRLDRRGRRETGG